MILWIKIKKSLIERSDNMKVYEKVREYIVDNGYKLEQMNVALVCEYLRNVGHDIPKPDRHICRILSNEYLAFSDKKEVTHFECVRHYSGAIKNDREISRRSRLYSLVLLCRWVWGSLYCKKGKMQNM